MRKLKKIEKEARAQRKGEILGEFDAHSKKSFLESLREHIGKTIDNVDPIEAMAIGSGTILIHQFILNNPDSLRQINNAYATLKQVATEPWVAWFGGLASYFGLGFLVGAPPGYEVEKGKPITGNVITDQLMLWMLSFVVAFVLIKYGGQLLGLLGAGAGGMGGIVSLFL